MTRGPATRYLRSAAGRRDEALHLLRDRVVELERRCSRQRHRERRLNDELTKFRRAGVSVLAALDVPEAFPDAVVELEDALQFHLAEPHKLSAKIARARVRLQGYEVSA